MKRVAPRLILRLLALCFPLLTVAACNLTPGDEQEPLVVGIVPSQSSDEFDNLMNTLTEMLGEELEQSTEASVGANYSSLVAEMGAGDVDVAFLGPTSMVQAIDQHGAVPIAASVRSGSSSYRAQFNVRCEGTIDTFADLDGATIAFVDEGSSSGYQFPYVFLKNEHGLDPDIDMTTEFAGSHDAAVLAVYNDEVDVGVSYEDARNLLAGDYPDVTDVVCPLGYTGPIPNDGQVGRSGLDSALYADVRDALNAIAATAEGAQVLGDLFNVTGFEEVDSEAYDPVRDVMEEFE